MSTAGRGVVVTEGRCPDTSVELLWIPLGAGANVVRLSGRLFEKISAFWQRRQPQDLYHSALRVVLPEGTYVIEMTPIPDEYGHQRGVVAEGPVGTRWAGHLRVFRYEIHSWLDGVIPDLADAVTPSTIVTTNSGRARALLDLVRVIPTPVWGRDELGAGEMWNSNSVTAWLLALGGFDMERIDPPAGGRAPGWDAGRVVASRTPRGMDETLCRGRACLAPEGANALTTPATRAS